MNKMKIALILVVSLVFTNLAFSQSKYSEAEINNMVKTYSFYLGQLSSVTIATEKFPSLKQDINTAQHLWNLNYKSSIENIVTELMLYFGEKFNGIENEILTSVSKVDYSHTSNEDVRNLISVINQRAKGDMPSPFLETLLSFNPTYQRSPEREMIDGFVSEYSTKESVKSEGVNVKIKYPKSWSSENGDRPHVIRKFKSENGHGLNGALIMIIKASLSKTDVDLLLSAEGLKSQIPKNSKVISVKTGLTMDNFPAASITSYVVQPQMNLKIGMISETYIICYKDHLISILFSVGSTTSNYDDILKQYNTNKNLFWRMANNLVILSQYE